MKIMDELISVVNDKLKTNEALLEFSKNHSLKQSHLYFIDCIEKLNKINDILHK